MARWWRPLPHEAGFTQSLELVESGLLMSRRLVPALAVAYYLAMVIFVTYPGYVPFNDIRPFVLGMPFALFWQVLWICGAVFVLATVFSWERSRRRRRHRESPPAPYANDAASRSD